MGRMGTAWETATAAVFLASDDASYITGAVIPVDGRHAHTCGLTAEIPESFRFHAIDARLRRRMHNKLLAERALHSGNTFWKKVRIRSSVIARSYFDPKN
jgi:hypothetical protein